MASFDISTIVRIPATGFLIPFQTAALMTEERKHAILFAAKLLSSRRLIESIQSDKPDTSKPYFVDRAIQEAGFILERVDKRWPAEKQKSWNFRTIPKNDTAGLLSTTGLSPTL
jgi:hypothetical protein